MNELVVTHQNALEVLEKQGTPESLAILDYVKSVKDKNIAVLGVDEAFVLQDSEGQIKAFKRVLSLSAQDGTLIQPTYNGPFVVSAQGYEVLNEATGTSVIFPKEVLVGGEWKPNPYAERDETNRRILAVHARAVAFKYSSMGIPQISDWTTIFDTPSYRMIDLLAKAKKFPQAFKVLPTKIEPEKAEKETWASYPFDESMNLWINTSHDEVITWLSQILNREKKAMDFAQTFAKRNASKHLHGIQKAPCDNWRFPILAWRPTGNNIVKWDAAQYANLQDRVVGMIEGGGADEFTQKIELQQGAEKTSEDENIEGLEAEVDPEDNQETEKKPDEQESQSEEKQETKPVELSRDVKQVVYLALKFPEQFSEACKILKINISKPVESYDDETAIKVFQKVNDLIDEQN